MNTGILFVISAPSGTGKTTLLRQVMERLPGLNFSVSHTTRRPRPGEVDGRDYLFVSRDQFEKMIADNQFLEWARVHDNYYGTSVRAVTDRLKAGEDILLDIDVQGAAIIRSAGQPASVHIFIAPPSLAVLESRLRGRNTEDEKTLQIRLQNARSELKAAGQYQYLVINDRIDEAVETLMAIFIAERARVRRRRGGETAIMETGA
jgi:guanylate kinase